MADAPQPPHAPTRAQTILISAALLVLGGLYGGLVGLSLPAAGLLGAALGAVGLALLPRAGWPAPRQDKARWLGALGLALLFCAQVMLPNPRLAVQHVLVDLAMGLHLPGIFIRLAKPAEHAFAAGVTFLLAFGAIFALLGAVDRFTPRPLATARKISWRQVILYALPCLLIWGVYLYAYWPGTMSSDSYDQWAQADHLLSGALNDWHPVGHTLLLFVLTRLWYSPASVIVFQILALGLAWGWAMAYFETRGLPRRLLLPLTALFALLPSNGVMVITLWKDIPYAIANFVLVLLLGWVWETRGAWLDGWPQRIGFGLVLGATYLMRHNGLIVLLLTPPVLLVVYRRHWRSILALSAVAALAVLGIRNGLAFGLLHAKANEEAVTYLAPIQHIDAVVAAGGEIRPDEQVVLEQIAPLAMWKKAYLPYMADNLTKPWGIMKDAQIFDKIRANKSGILQTFFKLSLRYPGVVLRSELDLTSILWRITYPPQMYLDYSLEYFQASAPVPPGLDPALFQQPNLGSPLGQWLSALLSGIRTVPLAYVLLWQGGLYLFLSLAAGVIGAVKRGGSFLLLLLPSLANLASLAAAMPGQNYRFIYPLVLPVFLIGLFVVGSGQRSAVSDQRSAKEGPGA